MESYPSATSISLAYQRPPAPTYRTPQEHRWLHHISSRGPLAVSRSSKSKCLVSQSTQVQFASVMKPEEGPRPPHFHGLGLASWGFRTWGLDGLGPLVPHGPRLRFAPWLSNEVIHMSMISSPSPAAGDSEPLGSQAQANWSRPRPRHADRPPSSRRHVAVRGWRRPNLVRYRHPAWPLLCRCGILCTQLSTREV